MWFPRLWENAKATCENKSNKFSINVQYPPWGLANSRGSWVVGRMSWVVGKKSWFVGKKSWVVSKKSWVVGKKLWVVGKKSWVVGKKSWVPRKKSWVLRKKSWVPNRKSWVPRKSRGFQTKCFHIFTFSLSECVFFVFWGFLKCTWSALRI
jgi:hypothetical protein